MLYERRFTASEVFPSIVFTMAELPEPVTDSTMPTWLEEPKKMMSPGFGTYPEERA